MQAPDHNSLNGEQDQVLPDIKPRYDASKASKPRVKVRKIPYSKDPLKKDSVFQLYGCAYICYGKKTKGRSQIQLLGEVETVDEEVNRVSAAEQEET